MKFRLGTILWVFALLAAAMSTFGDHGLAFAATAVLFWVLVFNVRRFSTWPRLLFFFLSVSFLLPAITPARIFHTKRYFSMERLRDLGATIVYHKDIYGQFPPAYIENEQGQALHSWRLAVLPELNEDKLYNRIQQDEPWNSPSNKLLTDQFIDPMCHSKNYPATGNQTNYFAIVDPRTAWPGNRGLKMTEIKDGLEQTILLIEAGNRNIAWAEPRDLTFDEAVELLTQPADPANGDGHWVEGGWFYRPVACRHVLFANGYVRTLSSPMTRKLAIALLTIDGGEEIDMDEIEDLSHPSELNYSRIYSLTVFVLLSLLPIRKLKRQERQSKEPPSTPRKAKA